MMKNLRIRALQQLFASIVLYFLLPSPVLTLTSEDCEIQDTGGFLQNVCIPPPNESSGYVGDHETVFKCVHTNQFYRIGWRSLDREMVKTVDVLCEEDPNFYQACAIEGKRAQFYQYKGMNSYSANYSCGFLCQHNTKGSIINVPNLGLQSDGITAFSMFFFALMCDGENTCLNTDLDESQCKSEEGRVVDCDMICDVLSDCRDESVCDGYNYGMWCDDRQLYIRPRTICDGFINCEDGSDESNCQVTMETKQTCRRDSNNKLIPIFNYTRCGPLMEDVKQTYGVLFKICADSMDQTNCTDQSRVGLHCQIRGYMSTVSRQIICIDSTSFRSQSITLSTVCDDGLDKECVEVSLACFLHKHQLCDGILDCKDHTDETQVLCQRMTLGECTRRYVSDTTVRSIPTAWIKDGVEDCLEGEDETDMWPTCGKGPTYRPKDQTTDLCLEVFLCHGSNEYVDFPRLCDRVDSCGNENLICQTSRFQIPTFNRAPREGEMVKLAYCQRGLRDIEYLTETKCIYENFISSKTWVFGRNFSQEVTLPDIKTDCRHYYGEMYVFLSCTGKCKTATCPLTSDRQVKFYSCPDQFKSKLFTVDEGGEMTFLIKNPRTSLLGNDFFLCQTGQTCLTYDKVCNLVDDCGDGSDEAACDNHFQCEFSKEYLHVSQQCDGVFHCADRSDECNEACGGTHIIRGIWLKVSAWLIGISAILLNSVGLLNNFSSLYSCKTEAALLTNWLVIIINIGDFLVGVYLTLLACLDTYHGAGHCKVQLEWITGTVCLALGISSTFGSQISLLSMAVLSIVRAVGIKNDIQIPRKKRKRSALKVIVLIKVIILISTLASFLPMLTSLEDYFVNGLRYENTNTLFVGCPDKTKHLKVIEKYYGRMGLDGELLKWSQIKYLVKEMFSVDYGGIKQTTLSFYGNDPVCVFKYFVRNNDPQRNFTISLLIINSLCFVSIATSYTVIAFVTKRAIGELTKANHNAKTSPDVQNADGRLRRVINAIIITDFLCWMPFTLVCLLHLADVTDATPWYPFFSILVLPINSVINPLLYNKVITRALDTVFGKCVSKVVNIMGKLTNSMNFRSERKQEKTINSFRRPTVPEQNKNSNNSGEATVLEQNKNSNNSSEATVLEQNKNSNNSSEATVLEQNKNGNNSGEATVLEQNRNSNNSSEATVLEQNKNSNNSSEATVLEQNKNSNNSSEATVLEQNKNSNNSGEATVLEQNKNSNNSSEATVLEQNKNSNNSGEATVLEQNKNSNNSSEATVLEQNKNSNNSGEATVLEQEQ